MYSTIIEELILLILLSWICLCYMLMQPRIEVPTCILVCEENPKIKLILKYMDEHALLLINLINKNMDKFCITHCELTIFKLSFYF